MNNTRRKELCAIIQKIEVIQNDLEQVRDEEQECFDNLPEGIADSERGEKFEECIDNLDSAISSIEEAIEYINGARE
jgi:exonuclease VII small subunit